MQLTSSKMLSACMASLDVVPQSALYLWLAQTSCLSLWPQGSHISNPNASLVLWVSGGGDGSLRKAGPVPPAEQELGMHKIIDP